MNFREADVKELDGQDHEVLEADLCSGWTDVLGKWNTGFPCPRMRPFCCGTASFKYCCTRSPRSAPEQPPRPNHALRQSVVAGCLAGSLLLLLLVSVASWLLCRRPPCRSTRRHTGGGVSCSSSGGGGLLSLSASSQLTSPLDDLLHLHAALNGQLMSCDPPPPYSEHTDNPTDVARFEFASTRVDVLPRQTTADSSRDDIDEASPHWSTKF